MKKFLMALLLVSFMNACNDRGADPEEDEPEDVIIGADTLKRPDTLIIDTVNN